MGRLAIDMALGHSIRVENVPSKISNTNAILNGIEVFEAFRHHIAFFCLRLNCMSSQ
jgi:hypothetical protein